MSRYSAPGKSVPGNPLVKLEKLDESRITDMLFDPLLAIATSDKLLVVKGPVVIGTLVPTGNSKFG